MATGRQFKELERKDVNQPDDKVTVTARVEQTTAEGLKQPGESFELPAKLARIMQKGGMVDVGVSDGQDEITVRVQAHDDYWNERKAIERAAKEARANAIKDNQEASPEEKRGQAGLAFADSGDPSRFSDSQSAYEAKLKAASEGGASTRETSSDGTKGQSQDQSQDQSEGQERPDDTYQNYTVEELKAEARSRENVTVNGKNKQELIDALREDDRKQE